MDKQILLESLIKNNITVNDELLNDIVKSYTDLMNKKVMKCCDNRKESYNKYSGLYTNDTHYRDLSFGVCDNCGEIWNLEFD